MEDLTLLGHAAASGLKIEAEGRELVITGPSSCSALVAEIARRKEEVLVELQARATIAETDPWPDLASQRWGGADASPGIDVPVDSWRWEVARWPVARWLAWNRRVAELMPAKADASTIRGVQRLAVEQIRDEWSRPTPVEPSPLAVDLGPAGSTPEATPFDLEIGLVLAGFGPVAEEDFPAWVDDEALTIRTADARSSIEFHGETLRAAERSPRLPGRVRDAAELARAEANLEAMQAARYQPSNEPNDQDGRQAR